MKISKFFKGLSIALFVPLFFFLIVRIWGGDGHVPMPPNFGIDKIDSIQKDGKWKYDTTFHQINDLNLTNQYGEKFSLNTTLKGKILVLNFYTTQSSLSDSMNKNLQFLEKAYKKSDSNMHYVSININPNDSTPQLRKYADDINADNDKWYLSYGNKNAIDSFIKNEIKYPLLNNSNDIFKKWIVVDMDRNVRGYYNGMDTLDIRRCADDISKIKLEKKKKHFIHKML